MWRQRNEVTNVWNNFTLILSSCISAPWYMQSKYIGKIIPSLVLNSPHDAIDEILFTCHHRDLTECSILSTMSWKRGPFIPAPDQLQPVHPVPPRTVFCDCEDLSERSSLQPTHTSMWLAPECKLQFHWPYFYDLHASSNDDDGWGDRSVVIHPFVRNSLEET